MTTTLKLEETAMQTSATRNETVHMGLYDAFASSDSERGYRSDFLFFDALPSLDALAAAQNITPVTDFEDLLGDSWPEGESVEDFIAAATEGRHEEDEPDS